MQVGTVAGPTGPQQAMTDHCSGLGSVHIINVLQLRRADIIRSFHIKPPSVYCRWAVWEKDDESQSSCTSRHRLPHPFHILPSISPWPSALSWFPGPHPYAPLSWVNSAYMSILLFPPARCSLVRTYRPALGSEGWG